MSDDNQSPVPFDFDFDTLNRKEPPEKPVNSFNLDSDDSDDLSELESGLIVAGSPAEVNAGTSESSFDLASPFGDDDLAATGSTKEPSASTSESSFDLENPFGDDDLIAAGSTKEPGASTSESSFDLENPFGDDVVVTSSKAEPSASTSESSFDLESPFGDDVVGGVEAGSGGNVLSDDEDSFPGTAAEQPPEFDDYVPPIAVEEKSKKKGFLGGIFGGKKDKAPKEAKTKTKPGKEKPVKEKPAKPPKEKKEKVVKEKAVKEKRPVVPRDWGTILCVVFSVFLLASLLMFNVATFLSRDANSTLMGTLCFLGAFNLVGLTLVAVPILLYKFPQERTLPNVLLGLSVGAMFTGVLLLVHNFYHYYGFVVGP